MTQCLKKFDQIICLDESCRLDDRKTVKSTGNVKKSVDLQQFTRLKLEKFEPGNCLDERTRNPNKIMDLRTF